MMHLFKNVHVVQSSSSHHGKQVDILIENGTITSIGNNLKAENAKVIQRKDLHVSAGWIDLLSHFMDPGHEYKETISTGLNAAAAGGFTAVAVMPNTDPAIDSAAQVSDLLRRSADHAVTLFPIGSITKNLKQEKMAELFDMGRAGAKAFCDGKKHIANSDLMRIVMLYAKGANAHIWSFPKDRNIAGKGYINEGVTSTLAGIKGVPALAEELAVVRDIHLSEYTECPVHFPMISTANSVELIRNAQKKGINATAGVASYHLKFSEENLSNLDPNLKTDHPLRTTEDRKALQQAVNDGVITCIVSDHTPQDHEAKVLEFGHAEYGMINLQTSFAMAMSEGKVDLEKLIPTLTTGPRSLLGIHELSIEENAQADLTFFCPNEKWTFTKEINRSLSKNSPVLGVELTGKPIAIVGNGQVQFALDI